MAVTPVRMLSPRTRVVWPTLTPATSVIAFSGPAGNTPTLIPRSRARGLASFCANPTTLHSAKASERVCVLMYKEEYYTYAAPQEKAWTSDPCIGPGLNCHPHV